MDENAVTESATEEAAWGTQLALESADNERLPRFLDVYTQGPRTPEPGVACDGGMSTP